MSKTMPLSISRLKEQERIKQEINLVKTLAVIVGVFLICWLSYAIVVLFFAETVPPRVKKVRNRLKNDVSAGLRKGE